jgi:hypothetical protein
MANPISWTDERAVRNAYRVAVAVGRRNRLESHDIRYRNAWIKELNLEEADTDF